MYTGIDDLLQNYSNFVQDNCHAMTGPAKISPPGPLAVPQQVPLDYLQRHGWSPSAIDSPSPDNNVQVMQISGIGIQCGDSFQKSFMIL